MKKLPKLNTQLPTLRLLNFMLVFALVGTLYLHLTLAALAPGWYGSIEKDQVNRINSARASVGKGGLQHIECLNSVAEAWTLKMAQAGSISHNPNLGSQIDSKCGTSWKVAGENVGVGYDSAGLFNAFMGSPSHKANIVGTQKDYYGNPIEYSEVGVGAYVSSNGKLWITQVFASCIGCGGNWNTNATVPTDPKQQTGSATGNGHFLRDSNTGGTANVSFNYGTSGDMYVYCDWDGDGDETVAAFRPSTRAWYIRNSNTEGTPDISFIYGGAGDLPICGDWNGDGIDTIGVFRPSSREWIMRNTNTGGTGEIRFVYGGDGDTPVVGDWDGNGTDTIGVFRPGNRYWYLRNSNSSGGNNIAFGYGGAGDKPIVGDWDGNGTTTIGVWRSGSFLLRNSNSGGGANLNFKYGLSTDKPMVGDWDGNGTTTVGILR